MAGTPGIKTYNHGWKDRSLYGRTSQKRAQRMPTAEEVARANAFMDRAVALIESGQSVRSIEKLVDREARIAVEGDTAMDDVPFGEKGE